MYAIKMKKKNIEEKEVLLPQDYKNFMYLCVKTKWPQQGLRACIENRENTEYNGRRMVTE